MHRNLLILIILTMHAISCGQAQEISLFNGRDLSGWAGLKEFWSVTDGAITGKITAKRGPAHNTFLVWQGGEVSDFEFTCKYKLVPDNPAGKANSGVQFRARMTNPQEFELKGYQGEMDPGTLQRDALNLNGFLTDDPPGATVAVADQKAAGSFRQKEWNDYRIIAVGNHFQIFVNGLPSVDATDDGNRFKSGLLGLQLHKGSGQHTIQFKDLKLKRLEAGQTALTSTTKPASSAPSAIQTDANQPRIEVLKEQAPNAIEWALAPLDQAVPGDIRQNLTFLRFDLQDEGAKKHDRNPEAYKIGDQICRALLDTLEERNQTLVRAGFRAVEANARTGVTSQALEATRNYKMSWPQYARETAQRAELKSQATNNAEVMKERPKMEWATRTAALRKTLDTLYAQFREALRQSPAAK